MPISMLIWLIEDLSPSPKAVAREYIENRVAVAELSEKYDIPTDYIIDCLNHYGIARKHFFGVGKRIACEDGHLVRSSLEKMVDDFLHEQGIPHEYEPKLPWGQCMADFKIEKHYVEVWGLVPTKPNPQNAVIVTYLNKLKEKRRLYEKHRLPLVELFPDDIPHNLVEKLGWLGAEVKMSK